MVTWKQTITVEPDRHARTEFVAARALPKAALRRDPLIAIRQEAWDDLRAHAASERVEVGGMLLGEVFRDRKGRIALDILHAIPALGARQEPTYYKLTDEAWRHICAARDAIDPDMLILGWYHSHPDLGAFFSGTDRASQRAFYNRPWNLGLVIDPIRDDLALFLGGDSERIDNDCLIPYRAAAVEVSSAPGVVPAGPPVWVRVPDAPAPLPPTAPPPVRWAVTPADAAGFATLGLLLAAVLRRVWRVVR